MAAGSDGHQSRYHLLPWLQFSQYHHLPRLEGSTAVRSLHNTVSTASTWQEERNPPRKPREHLHRWAIRPGSTNAPSRSLLDSRLNPLSLPLPIPPSQLPLRPWANRHPGQSPAPRPPDSPSRRPGLVGCRGFWRTCPRTCCRRTGSTFDIPTFPPASIAYQSKSSTSWGTWSSRWGTKPTPKVSSWCLAQSDTLRLMRRTR